MVRGLYIVGVSSDRSLYVFVGAPRWKALWADRTDSSPPRTPRSVAIRRSKAGQTSTGNSIYSLNSVLAQSGAKWDATLVVMERTEAYLRCSGEDTE